MAYLQVFSLLLYLAGSLAHTTTTPESSLTHSKERISADQVYHLGGETEYDALPTENFHSTTLEARDLFDDEDQSNVIDVLTRRDPALHENDRVMQQTAPTKQNANSQPLEWQTNRGDISSEHSQAQQVFSRRDPGAALISARQPKQQVSLQNILQGNVPQKNEQGKKPPGKNPWQFTGGGGKGLQSNNEVSSLFKRSAAKSTFNQNVQKGLNHNIHDSVIDKSLAGHGKPSSGTGRSKYQAPSPQNINLDNTFQKTQNWLNPQLLRTFSGIPSAIESYTNKPYSRHRDPSASSIAANGGNSGSVALQEVAGLYKRDPESNTEMNQDDILAKRAKGSKSPTPQGPMVYQYHGLGSPSGQKPYPNLFNKVKGYGSIAGVNHHWSIEGSELYKRDADLPIFAYNSPPKSSKSSKQVKKHTTLPHFGSTRQPIITPGSRTEIEADGLFKRDSKTDLLNRARKLFKQSKNPSIAPAAPGPSGRVSGGISQTQFEADGLFKRDADTELLSRAPVSSKKSPKAPRPRRNHQDGKLQSETLADNLYKRNLDSGSDLQARSQELTTRSPKRSGRFRRPGSTTQGSATALYQSSELYKRDPKWSSRPINPGSLNKGSALALYQSSELYKRDPNDSDLQTRITNPTNPNPITRPSKSPSPPTTTHRNPGLFINAVLPSQGETNDLYKRDPDAESDYLALVLEYLGLQNSHAESTHETEDNESEDEDDEVSDTDVDDDSLDKLATTIQTLASKIDNQLEQRGVAPKQPPATGGVSSPRSQTPASRPRPNRPAAPKPPCTGFLCGWKESQGAKGSGFTVHVPVNPVGGNDDPW